MPEPKTGEKEEDYIARCIPILIDEGRPEDQAAAICHSKWKERGNRVDKMELRANKVDNVKIQKEEEGRSVEGYGVVYNQEIELFPGFHEKISKGAFSRSLMNGETIKSYFNHDSEKVLSTTRSNPPLSLSEDDKGIYFRSPIPPTSYGNDLIVNLERNNVSGASFAFTVDDEDWEERSDGTIHRNIKRGTIYEVGPVTDPAYIQTSASLRNVKEKFEQRKKGFAPTTTSKPTQNEEAARANALEVEKCKLIIEKESL